MSSDDTPPPLGGFDRSPRTAFYVHYDIAKDTVHLTSDIADTIDYLVTCSPVRENILECPNSGAAFAAFATMPRRSKFPHLHGMNRAEFVQFMTARISDGLLTSKDVTRAWGDVLRPLSRQWISCLQGLRMAQTRITSKRWPAEWTSAKNEEIVKAFDEWLEYCHPQISAVTAKSMQRIAELEDGDPMRTFPDFSQVKHGSDGNEHVPRHLLHVSTKAALLEWLVGYENDMRVAHSADVANQSFITSRTGIVLSPEQAWAQETHQKATSLAKVLEGVETETTADLKTARQELDRIAEFYLVWPAQTLGQDPVSWAKLTRTWLNVDAAERSDFGELVQGCLNSTARAAATRVTLSEEGTPSFDPGLILAAYTERAQAVRSAATGVVTSHTDRVSTDVPLASSSNEAASGGRMGGAKPKRNRLSTRAKARNQRESEIRKQWQATVSLASRPRLPSESGIDLPWRRTTREAEDLHAFLKALNLMTVSAVEDESALEDDAPKRPGSAGGIHLPPLPTRGVEIEGVVDLFHQAE